MSLEDKLEALIGQVTRIADMMEGKAVHADLPTPQEATASKPNVGKDVKAAAKEEPTPTKEMETEAEVDVTFDRAHKHFFRGLTLIKEADGMPAAKKVCAAFMKKYTGGKEILVTSLPEDRYDEFHADAQAVRAEHNVSE